MFVVSFKRKAESGVTRTTDIWAKNKNRVFESHLLGFPRGSTAWGQTRHQKEERSPRLGAENHYREEEKEKREKRRKNMRSSRVCKRQRVCDEWKL